MVSSRSLFLNDSQRLKLKQSRNFHRPKEPFLFSFRFLLVILLIWALVLLICLLIFKELTSSSLVEESVINNNMNHRPKRFVPLNSKSKPITIAYAVSVTKCSDDREQRMIDGAAVLKHSIHLASAENPESGSKYFYKIFAIIHPIAADCSNDLSRLGYEVLVRDTPVDVSKIKGDFLREKIVRTGCCQEKELIKLWAYTLLDYPAVVHLDLDTLVLQPMDELFDAMIDGPESVREKIPVMFNATFPQRIDAYFTRDYNLVRPGKPHVGVQGGFFVVRPNQSTFDEYCEILLEGNYKSHSGWGGLGFGGFYGGQQIQGLLPYFYDHLHPSTAVELNRCYYNCMVDNPYSKSNGRCKDTGTKICQDCRKTDFSKVKLTHFTLCQKPWICRYTNIDTTSYENGQLCGKLHRAWFRIRKDLEKSWELSFKNFNSSNIATHRLELFNGFCKRGGMMGYLPIKLPPSLK